MWIRRKELEELKRRIANLEESRACKRVTVRGWRGQYGYSTDDHVDAEIGEALRLLAEHCGLVFERTPRVDSKLALKKGGK